MGTSRNIGRNNVVFDYEMTARGSTQIFSLCWLSLASVHTPTSTPLFLSHCVRIFDSTLCLPFYFFFFLFTFFPQRVIRFDPQCPSQGSCIRCAHADLKSRWITVWSAHGRDAIFCVYILWRIPLFLHADCHVHMHSWLQMLSIKSCKTHSGTSLEGLLPLPLSHLRTSCQLTSPLP